jgi:hypothetical protein
VLADGRLLILSGSTLTAARATSGLSIANGRVYIGTFGRNLYGLGIKR